MKRWVLGLSMVGCALPEPTLIGQHIEVAMDPGLEPCGDIVGYLDEYVAWLSTEWRVPPPSGDSVITYYWLDDVDLVQRTPCVKDIGACAPFGNVYSSWMPAEHEVVHAAAQRFGLPPPFFIEGLAMAYQVPVSPLVGGLPPGTVAQAIDDFQGFWLPDSMYPVAGSFVRFVIHRHGIDRLLIVYARLGFLDGRGRISRVFEDVLGESLEQVIAAYEQLGIDECLQGGQLIMPFECLAPALEWDGQVFADYFVAACEEEGAIGPYGGEVVVRRTLEVPADGVYELKLSGDEVTGSPRGFVRLTNCNCPRMGGSQDAAEYGEIVTLRAGRYVLDIGGPAYERSGVGLRIERVGDPVASVASVP